MGTSSPFYIYTDASFDHKSQTGVLGYCIFHGLEEHESGQLFSPVIYTQIIQEKNNIRSELRAVIVALEAFEEMLRASPLFNAEIIVYTDCQGISHLQKRRKKLEATHYISHRKKNVLANADLYKIFFLILDRLNPKIVWVKGHSPSRNQNLIQKNFSALDKAVRGIFRLTDLK